MIRYYTGIGSRSTPRDVLSLMDIVGEHLSNVAHMRSGGATGADSAFEDGVHDVSDNLTVYLPWDGFNDKYKSQESFYRVLEDMPNKGAAAKIAKAALGDKHWSKLCPPAKRLHTRNVYQVLGSDLATPSELVICWTPNGELVGGTATAIKIAMECDIRVLNFGMLPQETIIKYNQQFITNESFELLDALDHYINNTVPKNHF